MANTLHNSCYSVDACSRVNWTCKKWSEQSHTSESRLMCEFHFSLFFSWCALICLNSMLISTHSCYAHWIAVMTGICGYDVPFSYCNFHTHENSLEECISAILWDIKMNAIAKICLHNRHSIVQQRWRHGDFKTLEKIDISIWKLMVFAGFLMPMARHFKILSNVNPLQWITCSVVIEFENLKTKKKIPKALPFV